MNLKGKIDKFFKITERGSTVGKELLMGFIVFTALAYILPVNANILGSINGANPTAVFMATAICSAICCLVMGFVGNYPVILSAGMGMNSFLAFTVCNGENLGGMGFSFHEGLTLVFISGVIFFIITMTPLRQWIIDAIPSSVKSAISVGIGAFICTVGLKSSGVIEFSNGLPSMGNISNPTVLLGIFGIVLALILLNCKNQSVSRLAIVISMAAVAVLGLILGALGVKNMPAFSASYSNVGQNFKEFSYGAFKCFDFKSALAKTSALAVIFSLVFVSLFDATGTLIAVGKEISADGNIKMTKKIMLADACGAAICSLLGTSTHTAFAESAIATSGGARTGLTAVTTGVLFLLSIFIYPAFSIFASTGGLTPVTSLALVSVGAMMFKNLKDVDWTDNISVFTTFLIIIFMVLFYSISDGIGFGLIAYSLMMLFAKRGKEVHPAVYAIAVFFLINFTLNAFV